MGVPALFRWLSKKYPKIIYPVVEDEEIKVTDERDEDILVPINTAEPNPNGVEFDNLYLDMNGIVHPCTHPDGKPAPETEEEMMVLIFQYTERVVAMIRPRKLLFMAIDGVAPRAKMNQQRSRRFRAAQEAKEKEEARKESVALWEAMGKKLSDEEKNKVAWDSNAITPGTPFMDLLATSLRYWVAQKMNTDPGWKQMQVIISDASVPGEGEHKIMDFIRRQRSNTGHDPNTRHVIYGLDADLIMLALATHEPHFRVLREDVFGKDTAPGACRTCGEQGHYAAQCTGEKKEIQKVPEAKKPFIFLDVAVLREYLEVELNISQTAFPFNLEQAIDDWVLLIFFVGNDFLPHLPSLEIREGAIDVLLQLWKQELPRMGGYLTHHGQLQLSRAQLILEGLASRESSIFKKRREAEERQNQNAKRRKVENLNSKVKSVSIIEGPSPSLALTAPPTAPSGHSVHPSLPKRPSFAANADAIGLGGPRTAQSEQEIPTAAQALAGSNRDVVANRRAIRMANMSAAEVLKAELGGLTPLKPSQNSPKSAKEAAVSPESVSTPPLAPAPPMLQMSVDSSTDQMEVPGLDGISTPPAPQSTLAAESGLNPPPRSASGDADAEGEVDPDVSIVEDVSIESVAGVKRPLDEDEDDETPPSDEEAPADVTLALKVNADGTVDQDDTVRLWESGYQERYYRQKFGVEATDTKFKKEITTCYIEGMAWVLQYYYQGTPSWNWYYPYHFAPFAADFQDVGKMSINFNQGKPFKPFEQLMGVFPAASRTHIPSVFHSLMTDEDSPIIDFYPSTFQIDMNGKRMAWQGVALLPFIDEKRLLEAMTPCYEKLGEEEARRNGSGNDVLYASDENPFYPFLEALYGKRKNQEPVTLDPKLSRGINGAVLPNPDCLPGSTYYSPLPTQNLPDIRNDKSLSVLYFFPAQLTPHRSVLLPGVKRPKRTLSAYDVEKTVNKHGRGGTPNGGGRSLYGGNSMFHAGNPYQNDTGRGRGYNGNNSHQRSSYPPPNQRQSYQSQQDRGYSGSYRGNNQERSQQSYGGQNQYGAPARGGPPSSYNHSLYGQAPSGYGSPRGGYGYGGNSGGYGGDQRNGYSAGRGGTGTYNPTSRGRGRGW